MRDDDLKRRDQYRAPAKLHAWLSRVMQPALAMLLLLLSLAAEGQTGLGPNKRPNERPSRVIPPALATLLLLSSLAAEGQVGPGERLSGPALVGSMAIAQNAVNPTDADFVFTGPCKGNQIDASFSITLPFNVAAATRAADLEGIRFPGKGPAGCLSQAGLENLIVVTVTRFMNQSTVISAELVVLYVLPQ